MADQKPGLKTLTDFQNKTIQGIWLLFGGAIVIGFILGLQVDRTHKVAVTGLYLAGIIAAVALGLLLARLSGGAVEEKPAASKLPERGYVTPSQRAEMARQQQAQPKPPVQPVGKK